MREKEEKKINSKGDNAYLLYRKRKVHLVSGEVNRNSARQVKDCHATTHALNQYNDGHYLPKTLKLPTFGYLFKA